MAHRKATCKGDAYKVDAVESARLAISNIIEFGFWADSFALAVSLNHLDDLHREPVGAGATRTRRLLSVWLLKIGSNSIKPPQREKTKSNCSDFHFKNISLSQKLLKMVKAEKSPLIFDGSPIMAG